MPCHVAPDIAAVVNRPGGPRQAQNQNQAHLRPQDRQDPELNRRRQVQAMTGSPTGVNVARRSHPAHSKHASHPTSAEAAAQPRTTTKETA